MKDKKIIEAVLNGYEKVKDIATLQEYTEEVIRNCEKDIVRTKNLITLTTILLNMAVIFAALSFIDPQLIRNIIVSVAGGVLFWLISVCSRAEKILRTQRREESIEILKNFYKREFLLPGEKAFWEKYDDLD